MTGIRSVSHCTVHPMGCKSNYYWHF